MLKREGLASPSGYFAKSPKAFSGFFSSGFKASTFFAVSGGLKSPILFYSTGLAPKREFIVFSSDILAKSPPLVSGAIWLSKEGFS